MKMRNKTLLAVVATFSCMSLFCVGFANWTISQGATFVTGTISAEEVKESSYYIKFDRAEGLSFGPSGFTGTANSYTSTLQITYLVTPAHIVEIFGNGPVTITVSLGWAAEAPEYDLLTSDYISASVDGVDLDIDAVEVTKATDNSDTYRVSFSITPQEDDTIEHEFTVTYTVNFGDDADAYKNYIFDPFGDKLESSGQSSLGFKFNASIQGGAA